MATNNAILTKVTEAAILDGTIQPEEKLNTFLYWKNSGYHVKKGEKACVSTKLWKKKKLTKKEKEAYEMDEKQFETDYVLVTAYLFSTSQVEKN